MRLSRGTFRRGRFIRSGSRRLGRIQAALSPVWAALPRLELTRIQPGGQRPFFTRLHGLLDRYPVITMGQLVAEAGEQVWGLTVLLLALCTFVPGLANLLSLVTLLLGVSMMRGAPQPWLPGTVRRMVLHRGRIKDLLAKVEARIAWLAERRGPRKAPSRKFLGFLVAWTAFVAALPVPLPFANLLPAIALILYGVALLEEWPSMAWLGATITLATTVYFAFSIHEILVMSAGMRHWLASTFHPGWS